jgi:hypothetical protein
VVASRLYGCNPDPTAIAWLLLEAVSTPPGIYGSVSFVQRVNMTGGLAPSYPGLVIGQMVEVPYTQNTTSTASSNGTHASGV